MTITNERNREVLEKRRAMVELGKKVSNMLNDGYNNTEIANELGLSESNIRFVREMIRK